MNKLRILAVGLLVLLTLSSCPEPTTISWHDVTTFVNGWQNAAGYQPLQYGMDDWGQVHIRGTAYDPSPAPSSNVFTLPADYHPSYSTVFSIGVQSGGGTHPANLWIYSDGINSNQVLVTYSAAIDFAYFGEIIFAGN